MNCPWTSRAPLTSTSNQKDCGNSVENPTVSSDTYLFREPYVNYTLNSLLRIIARMSVMNLWQLQTDDSQTIIILFIYSATVTRTMDLQTDIVSVIGRLQHNSSTSFVWCNYFRKFTLQRYTQLWQFVKTISSLQSTNFFMQRGVKIFYWRDDKLYFQMPKERRGINRTPRSQIATTILRLY